MICTLHPHVVHGTGSLAKIVQATPFQSGSRLDPEKEEALLVSTCRELFDHLYKV